MVGMVREGGRGRKIEEESKHARKKENLSRVMDRLIDRFTRRVWQDRLRYRIQTQCLRQAYKNACMHVWIGV